ncbi:MAG: ParB/RepB/Spo0J family partition protein [Thomasclavelia ramosa]|nr:ParB/RepB/Spo0J family partition protein [Thomasclavelia ramosa]
MEYVFKVVDLSQLDEFPNHPYQVRIDEDLRNLQNSISERGVDEPLIVRNINDRYQVISGHRRMKACELAGIHDVPIRVVDLDDDEAVIMMVDSNLHRRKLLKSELAFAYRMKNEALKHQGKRFVEDETLDQLGPKYSTSTSRQIAFQEGTSPSQVKRYIRLTYLIKGLLDLVDEERIAMMPAYEISFLNKEQQETLLNVIEELDATPSLSQAKFFKEMAQDEQLDEELMYDELSEEKPNQKEKLKLETSKLRQYFPRGTTPREMSEAIYYLLEEHADELEHIRSNDYELKI